MAVYQYYLAVIPKKGIERRHDNIPNEIGTSTGTGFFEYNADIYWNEVQLKADGIIPKIDSIRKRAE